MEKYKNFYNKGYLWNSGDVIVHGDLYSERCINIDETLKADNVYVKVGDIATEKILVSGNIVAPNGYVDATEEMRIGGDLVSRICRFPDDYYVGGEIRSMEVSQKQFDKYCKGNNVGKEVPFSKTVRILRHYNVHSKFDDSEIK